MEGNRSQVCARMFFPSGSTELEELSQVDVVYGLYSATATYGDGICVIHIYHIW